MTGVIVLVAVLAAATAGGLVWRARTGRVRVTAAEAATLGQGDLGAPLGERATLLQFSSAFCAPCRATRQLLDQVSADVPGVSHVEIDAESHLDLVRRLGVLKTPTTLVLDREGTVVRRAAGVPRREQVLTALAEVTT